MHAERRGLTREGRRVCGVVGARVGDDVHVAADLLEHRLEQGELLGIVEGGTLAGGAREHQALVALSDQAARQRARGLQIERAVRCERRDHRGQDPAERAAGAGGTPGL